MCLVSSLLIYFISRFLIKLYYYSKYNDICSIGQINFFSKRETKIISLNFNVAPDDFYF